MLDLQEQIYGGVKKTYCMSADFVGRHVVGFEYLSMGVSLEVQNKRYNVILYLINYSPYLEYQI